MTMSIECIINNLSLATENRVTKRTTVPGKGAFMNNKTIIPLKIDFSKSKIFLRNILTAIEAAEEDTNVISEPKPPTFVTVIDGKEFDSADVETIAKAIKSGKIIV